MEGDDGLALEDALRRIIEIMGIKEFCQFAKSKKVSSLHESNVVDFIKGKRVSKRVTWLRQIKGEPA